MERKTVRAGRRGAHGALPDGEGARPAERCSGGARAAGAHRVPQPRAAAGPAVSPAGQPAAGPPARAVAAGRASQVVLDHDRVRGDQARRLQEAADCYKGRNLWERSTPATHNDKPQFGVSQSFAARISWETQAINYVNIQRLYTPLPTCTYYPTLICALTPLCACYSAASRPPLELIG